MYEYGNARIRAKKGRLLGRRAFEALVARGDVGQLITALGRLDYEAEISAAMARLSGVECVEEALRLNIARTTKAILGFYEGGARNLVGLVIGRLDLHNLLTIVRGKAVQTDPEEITSALLPGGELGDAVLRGLAEAPDLRQTVDLMATWRLPCASPLTRAMREYLQTREISTLESELARCHYSAAGERLSGNSRDVELVRRLLGQEIDVLNLTTVLRIRASGSPARSDGEASLLLDGGERLDRGHLSALLSSRSVEEVVTRIGSTPYADTLRAEMGQFASTGRVSVLQQALDRRVARWAISLFHDDPLGIGPVIAYVSAKTNEIVSLRLIARGISLGMDRDELFARLWLPDWN